MDKQTKAYTDALACAQSLRAMLPATALGPRSMQIVGAQINNELAVIAASVNTLREWRTEDYFAHGMSRAGVEEDAAAAIKRIATLVAALVGAK